MERVLTVSLRQPTSSPPQCEQRESAADQAERRRFRDARCRPTRAQRVAQPNIIDVPVFRRVEIETVPVEALPRERQTVEPGAHHRIRNWFYAAAGILVVAGALIAWRMAPHRESSPSIAVLPFANLSANPDDQYFSDGLTDEIIDSLARVKTLRVIARSSAFQFKGKPVDIREAGRLLNVATVLEGSVERSGDRIKIIAHLERVSDGSLLWSNTYERKASDLFAVQSELASGIAGGLKVAAGVPAATHTPSPEAHDFVMKGRYGLEQLTTGSLAQAESDFQRAVDLDPQCAAAYSGLGQAAFDKAAATGLYVRTAGEREKAENYFRKALELDPDLPAAHAALARLALQYDWDWGRAEREIQAGLAGPPSAAPESAYAAFLIARGRFAEADAHLRRCQDLDPFSTRGLLNLASMRNLEGRFAEARQISQQLAATYPQIPGGRQLIGLTYLEEGRPDLALADLETLKQYVPFATFREAMARALAGQREEALRLIRPYEEKYPNTGVSTQWFAGVYASMGDEPNTVKWLERLADQHEWAVLNIAVNPAFAAMRNSPRFRALKKRIGLDQ